MALIKCPEPNCGRMVSTSASACPGCGCPISGVSPGAEQPNVVIKSADSTAQSWDGVTLNELQSAADNGDAEAQFRLALRLQAGRDECIPNELEAAKWFRKAADQNHSEAQIELAKCYGGGCGVVKNHEEQEKWLRRSAENGHAHGQYLMYLILSCREGQEFQSFNWLKRAAEGGYPAACEFLAHKFRTGAGVDENQDEYQRWGRRAVELYRLAAVAGDADAQHQLGRYYESPMCIYVDRVEQDYSEAIKWYCKAAEQGHAGSLAAAGWCYEHGMKNLDEAVRLYRAAAEDGDPQGQRHLGWCYEDGKGVLQNRSEAIHWYRLAAAQNDSWAQERLKKYE